MKLTELLKPKLDRLGEGSAVQASGEVFVRNSSTVDSWSSPNGRHYKSDHIEGNVKVIAATKREQVNA
ncbi:hypothetical protein KHQ84_gp170 [Rhodococcus phage Finch]|uniref:Uncharacterized protein n=1 Tax=Rhodococcus phage Finch TaxID=2094144 RepID=A0A2P1JXN8_9CAUD|nr:hypothetical protein KHQ84_gp170 [Rhodococcus phage Finch]AVO25098.1 hypothetical protein SEA_FINCH_170 [Rhodococcus phage Finch]